MIIKPVSANCGDMNNGEFLFPVRVYYEDTDAGRIVYYANYLKFAERARTEFVRCLGLSQNEEMNKDDEIAFVVRHCDIDYIASAVLDDELIVSCRVTEVGGASLSMHQEIRRDDKILVDIEIKLVAMSLKTMRPVRVPAILRDKLV